MNTEDSKSHSDSAHSASTSVTTPDQSPGNDDDIWASDGEAQRGEDNVAGQRELLSDLPTVRRQHMTDGYREGLSVGKAKVMQQGFDEGYPIGVQIALRAGNVLGILEGVLASRGIVDAPEKRAPIQKTYDQASSELAITSLLKDTNDQILSESKAIPEAVLLVLRKWEELVIDKAEEKPLSSK